MTTYILFPSNSKARSVVNNPAEARRQAISYLQAGAKEVKVTLLETKYNYAYVLVNGQAHIIEK